MAFLVPEILELPSIQPESISFVRFEFHFQHARFLVGFIFRLPKHSPIGAFPGLDPAPRAVRHFLAESHFDFNRAGRDVGCAGFGYSLDDYGRHRINVLLSAGLEWRKRA